MSKLIDNFYADKTYNRVWRQYNILDLASRIRLNIEAAAWAGQKVVMKDGLPGMFKWDSCLEDGNWEFWNSVFLLEGDGLLCEATLLALYERHGIEQVERYRISII